MPPVLEASERSDASPPFLEPCTATLGRVENNEARPRRVSSWAISRKRAPPREARGRAEPKKKRGGGRAPRQI